MIESLESRIAPASLILGGKGVTFTDTDGDTVTVKTTKGAFDIGNNITFVGGAGHERIYFIDCDSTFSGANLTGSVKKAPGGDGKASVTAIDAANVNLGSISIPGDLESLKVGNNDIRIKAIGSLKVGSFGVNQSLLGVQQSTIDGKFGSISIAGDFSTERLEVLASTGGTVAIGGKVIGGSASGSGVVEFPGIIGSLVVKGGIYAGSDVTAGTVFVQQAASVKIIGTVADAADAQRGGVTVGNVATLSLGTVSGSTVHVTGGVKTLNVAGVVKNGGFIATSAGTTINAITIKSTIFATGGAEPALSIGGQVGTLTVGFVRGGGAGNAPVIFVHDTIKALKVKGDVEEAKITVLGLGPVSSTKAVGSISIDGNVTNAFFNLLNSGVPATSLAVVGKITVGKDWISSTLSAGTSQGPNPPVAAVKGPTGVVFEGLTIKGVARLNALNTISIIAADEVKFVSIKGKKAALVAGVDEQLSIFDATSTEVMVVAEVA